MALLSVFAVVFTVACGTPQPAAVPRPPPRFVEAATGRTVSLEALLEVVGEARIIYVGERHDRAEDHAAQTQICRALAARGSLAIGFEMFQRPYQSGLDEYASGAIDEAAMLERVEWETRWGFGVEMYRPMIELGREGVRLVALNAPKELTRAVARGGLDSLDGAQRASLPELDLTVESHRAMVAEALSEHPRMTEALLERFYAAQVIWDETMAEAVAATMTGPDAPERMVVLAGSMHVRRDAIPARAARRGAPSYAIVTPVAEADLEEALAEPPADFLFVTAD